MIFRGQICCDFQGANLLLATVNFEPCSSSYFTLKSRLTLSGVSAGTCNSDMNINRWQ